ncbi:CoA-binding protein [Candidatus Bathyarchaeota archaeon]|nr:CoA-binding protein [Candidatus Bathyarchaeota archaeon]
MEIINCENYDFKETSIRMKRLIEPRSVAIIGANNKIDKVGGAVTRNALGTKFDGEIFLVNPNATEMFGQKVYPDIESIPNDIDVVEVVVHASLVPGILEQAAKKGIKGAIIISSGFAEVGKRDLQDQITQIAQQNGISTLGPNCFGLINTEIDLDLSFTFSKPLRGSIAFVSQSGAMCCGTLDWAAKEEVGFSKFINLGNKCDVDEADCLAYLKDDPQTKVIAMYVEGIKSGRKLFEAIKSVSDKKPIIILKSGVTESGAKAALSHTGSIAGNMGIIKAALTQAGAIIVEDIEELYDTMQVFSQPYSNGRNVAIITNAGGLGVVTADWCSKQGLTLPEFPQKTVQELMAILPSIASPRNPIDMTGNANYQRYKETIEKISALENIDMIIALYVSQGLVASEEPARAIVDASKVCGKPLLAYFLGGSNILNGTRILKRGGIPVYSSPMRVARAAAVLASYSGSKTTKGKKSQT